jgi:hypothetical protein
MEYKDAYQFIAVDNGATAMDKKSYAVLQTHFEENYLLAKKYEERLERHRTPVSVKHQTLNELNEYLLTIQARADMRDNDEVRKVSGYVPSRIREIWEEDIRMQSEFEAVEEYCKITGKDIYTIGVHMAEYRSLSELFNRIHKQAHQIKSTEMTKIKQYDIKRANTFEKDYLKVYLKQGADLEQVANVLETIAEVRRANVTNQQSGNKDLTIYPALAYDIQEVEAAVIEALDNYFAGNPVDPQRKQQVISSVSDQAYKDIISFMSTLGKNLETSTGLNKKMSEEEYRDYFIPALNAISQQHSAKGEVYNKKGKTDILVFDNEGNNVFLAECKLWKGASLLHAAVDQLLGNYVNWRDNKTALVVFNRDVQKFSDVITTARDTVRNHPNCVRETGRLSDTSYSFLFQHPDDPGQTLQLELVLFNCY